MRSRTIKKVVARGREGPMNGPKKRIVGKAIGVTIAAASFVVGLGVPGASAVTYQVERQPGSVYFYQAMGYNIGGNYSVYNSVSLPAPYAYRDAATASSVQQTVYVQYVLVNLTTGASEYRGWYSASIASGAQGAWLPGASWTPSVPHMSSNSFQTAIEVRWYVGNTYLGGRRIIYNQNGDYGCGGGSVSCWASDRLMFANF
jgi:hypothetical protein